MNQDQIEKLRSTSKIINESLFERKDKIIHISDFEEQELSQPFPTGFKKLDECILGGFREGDLIILSGLSKHGKSQVSLQMTKAFSIQAIPVLWFSFEMPVSTLRWRFNKINRWTLKKWEFGDKGRWEGLKWIFDVKKYSEEEIKRKQVSDEKDLLCYMPKENTSDKVEWLEERIIDANKRFLTKIVIIDNLDFLTIEQKYGDDKLTMQKRIVGMLKRIAIKLNIVVILNAHVAKLPQGQKRPKMSNIYGASETYKLADLILFIYRKQEQTEWESRNKQPEDIFSNEAELLIDGNRLTGLNRTIKLDFKNNLYIEI